MAHITTSDVHNVYEQYAIELTQADASAIADDFNATSKDRAQAIEGLHGAAQMARAVWEDANYERCRDFADEQA